MMTVMIMMNLLWFSKPQEYDGNNNDVVDSYDNDNGYGHSDESYDDDDDDGAHSAKGGTRSTMGKKKW